jgi:hypothetical protein
LKHIEEARRLPEVRVSSTNDSRKKNDGNVKSKWDNSTSIHSFFHSVLFLHYFFPRLLRHFATHSSERERGREGEGQFLIET